MESLTVQSGLISVKYRIKRLTDKLTIKDNTNANEWGKHDLEG